MKKTLFAMLLCALLALLSACGGEVKSPTEAPTDEYVTGAPTEKSTETLADVPTEEPTDVPTETWTEAPTEEITESPTEAPYDALGKESTEDAPEDQSETETEEFHDEFAVVDPNLEIDLDRIYEAYIQEFTFFPMSLINYIGSEDFYAWIKNSGGYAIDENGEAIPTNIVDCLRYFNISREECENIYYGGEYYSLIYDIDIMYNGTDEEIREYFKDFEKRREESDKRINILDNKMAFRRNISNWTADENVIRKYEELPVTAWTFTDIIYDANIPREDAEAIFAKNEIYDAVTGKAKFNHYDLDKIYKYVSEMEESGVMNTDFSRVEGDYFKRVVIFESGLISETEIWWDNSDVREDLAHYTVELTKTVYTTNDKGVRFRFRAKEPGYTGFSDNWKLYKFVDGDKIYVGSNPLETAFELSPKTEGEYVDCEMTFLFSYIYTWEQLDTLEVGRYCLEMHCGSENGNPIVIARLNFEVVEAE